jgi:hypothetical protein
LTSAGGGGGIVTIVLTGLGVTAFGILEGSITVLALKQHPSILIYNSK